MDRHILSEQPVGADWDVNGWGIRKALKRLHRSNPVLVEWLRSPIVYAQDDALAPRLRTLGEQHLSLDRERPRRQAAESRTSRRTWTWIIRATQLASL